MLYDDLLRITSIINSFIQGGKENLKEVSTTFNLEELSTYVERDRHTTFDSQRVVCEYDDSVDQVLHIGDKLIFNFDEPMAFGVTLLVVGKRVIEAQDLQLGQVYLLQSRDCFLVERPGGGEFLLLVTPADVSRTYEAIVAKRKHYEKHKDDPGHNRECYFNTYCQDRDLRNSDQFEAAKCVLHFHFQNKTEPEILEHLINWLRMFGPDEQKALVEVIAAHKCISSDAIENFKKHLDSSSQRENLIVATLKTPNDLGGIYRLLSDIGYPELRYLRLDSWVSRFLEREPASTELMFISDVLIGGGQTLKAFKRYYLKHTHPDDEVDKQKYHPLESQQSEVFLEKFMHLNRISFHAALITENAETKIKNFLLDWYHEHGLPVPEIVFSGGMKVDFQSVVLDNNPEISVPHQKLFRKLIVIEEMSKRFKFEGEDSKARYRDQKSTNNRNLVVRIKSVPKYAYRIFTLYPQNADVPPLFNTIKEHRKN